MENGIRCISPKQQPEGAESLRIIICDIGIKNTVRKHTIRKYPEPENQDKDQCSNEVEGGIRIVQFDRFASGKPSAKVNNCLKSCCA